MVTRCRGWDLIELLHRSHKIGLTERRAQWFQKWTRVVKDAGYVHMSSFEEGLGRVMYVAGALEYERPFVSPLYRFVTLHPRGSIRRLPSYVIFILRYSAQLTTANYAPRVDAQASEGRTGVGGWCQELDVNRVPDPSRSLWFSVEIDRKAFPWIYCKGDRASRVIAMLESLAVLLALKAFYSSDRDRGRRKVRLQPTWTDNRGNGAALNKLMSTQFPIKLAVRCKRSGILLWVGRLGSSTVRRTTGPMGGRMR